MKRIIAVILLLMLALPCIPAGAEQTVYADYNVVQVYAKKSTSSKKLGKLSYGESITCLNTYEYGNKGWAKLKNENGKIGYCEMSAITGNNPNILDFKLKTRDGAKMYAKPRISSKVLARFTKDVDVKIVALTQDGKWFRVKYAGHFGYMLVSQFKGGKKAWYLGENDAVTDRYGNGENLLSYGESLKIYGVTGKTAVVKFGGRMGYILDYKKSDFSSEDPCSESFGMYVLADGVRMNSEAVSMTSAYVQRKLKKYDRVTLYGAAEVGRFYRVKYKGKYGYILKSCIAMEKPGEDVIVIARNDINIYKGKLSGSDIVGDAKKGDELILLSVKVNRAKVTHRETGITGWIKITEFK